MDLFTELRRRNVFKVAIVYAVVGWVVVQIADIMTESFGSPEWVMKTFIGFMMLGFPIAVIFAWAFEMTPQGLMREKDLDRSGEAAPADPKFKYTVIGLFVLALGYFAYQQFFSGADQAGLAEGSDRSIAVIPFANRSANEEDAAFFADGIHDDLLTVLSRISDLRVISRTSVERYRGSEKSIPEIAAELGVSSVLEGSVQRAGDRVRINAQLINASTDEHIWAEIYDEELTAENIFDIQQRIAADIASALHSTLSDEEAAGIMARPTANLEAYEASLRGRELLRIGSAEALEAAETLFERALELDPEFALAWIGLAQADGFAPWFVLGDAASVRILDTYIDNAFLLEPDLVEAHIARGQLRYSMDRFEGAELSFRRALRLNPNNAEALHRYGLLLLDMRRPEEALPMLDRALELDPLSPSINLDKAAGLELAGDFEGALEQYHHTLEVEPEFVDTHGEIAWLYWDKLEQMDEAVRWFERALEIDPENEALLYRLMELYLDLSDIRSAEAIQQRLADLQVGLARQSLSVLHNYREEFDQAVEVSRETLARNPTDPSATYFLGNALMLSGRTQEALDLYQTYQPALFGDPPQKIDSRIDRMSLNIAAALIANGEEDAAQYFIDGSSAVLATGVRHAPAHFDLAFDIADVENFALRGETEEALTRLRAAIDEGWRHRWWWLKYRPTLASIRDRPEFQAMVAELEADAAMQRQRLEASRAAD